MNQSNQKKPSWWYGLGCGFVLCALPNGMADSVPTLSEWVQILKNQTPSVQIKALSREQSILEVKNARSRWLPTLEFTSHHGWSLRGKGSESSPWSSSVSVSLVEDLSDIWGRTLGGHQAQLRLELAQLDEEREQIVSLKDALREWLVYSRETEIQNLRSQQRSLVAKQLKSVQDQFHQGFKLKSDYLQMKTEVSQLDLVILRGKQALRKIFRALSLKTREVVAVPKPLSLQWTSTMIARGLEEGTLWREKSREVELSQKVHQTLLRLHDGVMDEKQRSFWPKVGLVGRVGWGLPELGDPLDWQSSVGVQVQWTLWDWGIRSREMQGERVKNLSEQIRSEQALRERELDRESGQEEWEAERLNHQLVKEALQLEEESLRSVDDDYRNGRVSVQEWIQSRKRWVEARMAYVNQSFSFLENLLNARGDVSGIERWVQDLESEEVSK